MKINDEGSDDEDQMGLTKSCLRNLIDFTKASHGIPIEMKPERVKLKKFIRNSL
jgi:hypothetical protein